jgi:hypothetical protein
MEHGVRIRTVILLCLIMAMCMPQMLTAQSCLPDGISFTHQTDIDSFHQDYPGCTNIEGNVYIAGNSIYNLQGLQGLEWWLFKD